MKGLFPAVALSLALATSAQAATVNLADFVRDENVKFSDNLLNFDSKQSGTATFTITGDSLFTLSIAGQNSGPASFDFFFNNTQLANNVNLQGNDKLFDVVFNDLTGPGVLTIVSQSSKGNFEGKITAVDVTFRTVAVPGPITGAGLPVLMALGGLVWARRRKASATA